MTSFFLRGNPEQYLPGVPPPKPVADAAKASSDLKSTLALRLEYVLDADETTAVLRYLPESGDAYYVDSQSGKLVNLSTLYVQLDKGTISGGAAEAPAAAPETAADAALSDAEQAGIAAMTGVLSKEALDAAARKWGALGLSRYTLVAASYHADPETNAVHANLQYAYKKEDGIFRRYVSLDAKNGALLCVSSAPPWHEQKTFAVTAAQAQVKAEAFLKELTPAQFAKTALYHAGTPEQLTFQFAQKENGIFFPRNSLHVGIDPTAGSICNYDSDFQDAVTFQNPAGIMTESAALDTWFATYAVTLGYVPVPAKLDLRAPKYQPLIEMGHSYLLSQKLGWTLVQKDPCLSVDAKTGKPVSDGTAAKQEFAYADLSGHWVKAQAEQLAAYGIGWTGGNFRPDAVLTQVDLVSLLVRAAGYAVNLDDEAGGADFLYERAAWLGILSKEKRNDSAVLTRGETVKLLLDALGFSGAANLPDIFKCNFSDEKSIPTAYYGYAALAQGLGIAFPQTGLEN